MAKIDAHTLRVLEFEKVLEMASQEATTSSGRFFIEELHPLSDLQKIKKRQTLVSELRKLHSQGKDTGIEHFEDLSGLFRFLKPEEAVCDGRQLRLLLPLFYSIAHLRELAQERDFSNLVELINSLSDYRNLRREIESAIERDGSLKDTASSTLYDIRTGIKALEERIKNTLERILHDRSLKPHIQDFYITERNGRKVIPVKTDSKGHIRGVIHDVSNTGETVFVEPYETLSLGNELESLRAEEKVEEYRILKSLTGHVRSSLEDIEKDYRIVVYVDALEALARFADRMDMIIPEINKRGIIRIVEGRHPLLWRILYEQKREEELVPLDLSLGGYNRVMVITGSNAGGKTVALKTVGILELMALSGMPIPAREGTTLPYLEHLIADIGDEQSIEESLSTFSAHLIRLKDILSTAKASSLVIIDELGTGTDPDEGGALGCSILDWLNQKGSLVVVSTHLALLKVFAEKEEGIVNAAMEMVVIETEGKRIFKPTYRLTMGRTGRSHALEIASHYGIPDEIISKARDILKEKGYIIEDVLERLSKKEHELQKEKVKLNMLSKEAKELKEKLQDEIEETKRKRREIIEASKREAEEIIRKALRTAEEKLKSFEKIQRPRARQIIKELSRELQKLEPKKVKKIDLKRPEHISTGQKVFVSSLGKNAIVVSIDEKKGRCTVNLKGKDVRVLLEDLYEAKEEKNEKSEIPFYEERTVPREINIIGMTPEEALPKLDRLLNDACLAGVDELRIIHGIGTGRLREAVRSFLRDHPLVKTYRKEEGVTIVEL